ncbi:hypothetical protein [Amycolatopsis sp.]|uniref:hypothetical protein n=1 Tax=Amycolatopsis sp. TaxID=37632 RepID=UPI002D80842A|nr:hypothetical protein [Amycolatopsis sp.]HET6708841.1 hypothetical protein [Amycolatopsis sp.]
MSTSATIESRVPALEEIAPLEMGLPQSEKAWFHAFAHKAVDAWVNITGGSDGVLHENPDPVDFGEAGAARFSLEDLLETRTQRVS